MRVRILLFIFFLLLHAIFWLYWSRQLNFTTQQFLDFDAYYALAKQCLTGINPYQGSMPTLGPPLVILLYLPFALLNLSLGRGLFLLLNIAAGYFMCFQLAKKVNSKYWGIIGLIIGACLFASFPVRFSLLLGQPALIVAWLVTLLLLRRHWVLVSAGLITIKTFFVFSLLAWLRSEKTMLVKILIVLMAVIGISSLILQPRWYLYYARHTFVDAAVRQSTTASLDYYNQSLRSTLYRLHLPQAYPLVWLLSALLLMYLTYQRRSLMVGIVGSLWLSPILWQHYVVFLFPLYVLLFFQATKKQMLILAISYLLISVQSGKYLTASPTIINGLLASHFFWGILLLISVLWWDLWHPNPRVNLNRLG